MIAFSYIAMALFAAALAFLLLWFTRKREGKGGVFWARGLSLALGAAFFVRFFGGNFLIEETIGLNMYSPFGAQGGHLVLLSMLLIWLSFTAAILVATFPFFKKYVRCITPLVRYAGTAIYLLALIGLPMVAQAMDGEGALQAFHWRDAVYALEVGLGLGISLYELLSGFIRPTEVRLPTRTKDALGAALALVGMFLISIPPWAIQSVFGLGDPSIKVSEFNLTHRIVLYVCLALGLTIHFLFTRQEYEVRRYALIYISLATLVTYCYDNTFSEFFDLTQWPLHLCHTAMFIVPICLIFKFDKLYYFTMFINVLGAFFAMIMPDVDNYSILGSGSVMFWVNHYCAFLLPILLMSLRMFARPKLKQFIYSLVAFTIYFIAILFVNAYLTNFDSGVDFFFLNSDFIASKLGDWAEDLRDYTATIPLKNGMKMVLYPVYQSLFYVVYLLLALAMWFLYEQAFEIGDMYALITERSRKIKADRLALEVHLAGRDMQEPMNPENQGKLILRHFSKRYSTSDVYAVHDANLEIEGGQIFGFLGPNGAGKSTIIKSIVGIQTITSGEIEISGYDVEKQAVGAKMQIGFVPDHYALYENLTGREYINYIADLYNVSKADRDARISDYVARFNLAHAFDNPMKTYSHGMKQKITIMSALVHNPKVWILDEPLTGLDPESIFQVKECMKEHASRGNIVFFSSHIIDVVERICDKIAIIRKGQILVSKTVAEIEAEGYALEDFYMQTIGDGGEAITVGSESAKIASAKA